MGFNYAGYEAAWSNAVEEIKRIPMRDVLGQLGMDTGRNNMIRCFVHNDSNPSMQISTTRSGTYLYHCFACGASGSNIDLVMHIMGLDFKESVYWLGGTFGISIPDKRFYYGEGFEAVERFPLTNEEILALELDPGNSQVFIPRNAGDLPNEKLNSMNQRALEDYYKIVLHRRLPVLPKDTLEYRKDAVDLNGAYIYGTSQTMSLRKLWRGDENWGNVDVCREIFFGLVCSKLMSILSLMLQYKYSGKCQKIVDALGSGADKTKILMELNKALNKRIGILQDLRERLEDDYPEYTKKYGLYDFHEPTRQEVLAMAQ